MVVVNDECVDHGVARRREDHPRIRADPRGSRMHALYFSFFIFFFLTSHRPSIFPSPAVIGLRKKYLPPLEADRNWISARARARDNRNEN